MRLLILGASSFIGTHLIERAIADGHGVVALCRSGRVTAPVDRCLPWALGQPIPPEALEGIDCAVHLAHDFSGEAGARLTLAATTAGMRDLSARGIRRQLFFSSYSAGPHATSIYGRTKFAMEQAAADSAGIIIVRPGLVLGDAGIYGRIRTWAQKFPLVPLPDGGRGTVPVITVERLCRETLRLAAADPAPGEANLFEPDLRALRDLVRDAAGEVGRRPWIVPIPSALMLAGLEGVARLHLPLPVNADNLRGFLANAEARHVSTLSADRPPS